jgi:hypothetical protein
MSGSVGQYRVYEYRQKGSESNMRGAQRHLFVIHIQLHNFDCIILTLSSEKLSKFSSETTVWISSVTP